MVLSIWIDKDKMNIKPGELSRLKGLPTNLKVMGSSSTLGKNFSFYIFRLLRAPSGSTEPI